MTRDETKQILMRIQSIYPNWKPAADLSFVVETWWEYLADVTYESAKLALKAYARSDTSGFAPSVGQLMDKIVSLESPNQLNEMEAWSLVSMALRKGYYYAEQEFEKLPTVIQKAVGSAGNLRNWSITDNSSVENVIQSNFIKTYRAVLQRNNEYMKYPEDVRTLIESTGRVMIEGEGGGV